MDTEIEPVRSEVVFENRWLQLEALTLAAHPAEPYFRIVEGPGIICITLSAEGDFVMVRQARPVIGAHTLEFPAGGIDAGEGPEEAVRREVREETGLALDMVRRVGWTEPVPSRLHAPQSLYVGICAPSSSATRPEGGTNIAVIPRHKLLDAFRQEGMHCAVALGIIKLAELLWSIDIFNDSIDVLRRRLAGDALSLDHSAGTPC